MDPDANFRERIVLMRNALSAGYWNRADKAREIELGEAYTAWRKSGGFAPDQSLREEFVKTSLSASFLKVGDPTRVVVSRIIAGVDETGETVTIMPGRYRMIDEESSHGFTVTIIENSDGDFVGIAERDYNAIRVEG